jgi:hypothetical protein
LDDVASNIHQALLEGTIRQLREERGELERNELTRKLDALGSETEGRLLNLESTRRERVTRLEAGAYTRPLFSST